MTAITSATIHRSDLTKGEAGLEPDPEPKVDDLVESILELETITESRHST